MASHKNKVIFYNFRFLLIFLIYFLIQILFCLLVNQPKMRKSPPSDLELDGSDGSLYKMTSQIDKTSNNIWKEKEALMSTQGFNPVKSVKRMKSPKKPQEYKSTTNEMKIDDVFLNSEYFKYQSGKMSSLCFCSGNNGENQWTIDTKFEIPLRRKSAKLTSYPNGTIKSDTAVAEKEKVSKQWSPKIKKKNDFTKESNHEETEKFIEGILSEKGKIDPDVISLITEQMFLAERELQITRTHLMETINKLNERDLEIIKLHEKIQQLQKFKTIETKKSDGQNKEESEGYNKTSEDYERLITASEKLKKQVKDMEDFLKDYGLVWVGEKDMINPKPDFDKIIKSFQRLNAVASQPKIIQTTVGAKFELPRDIPLVLYSNGLLLRNSDFREYSKMSTSLFLQDVEDGYFPSELQAEFPEGVPFELIDKRNEEYNVSEKAPIFKGQGNRLGSTFEGKPPPIVYLEPQKRVRNQDSHTALGQESLDKYSLKKIHKKKSRNTFLQEEKSSLSHLTSDIKCRFYKEYPEKDYSNSQDLLKTKIRFGKEKTESFVLQVPENEKLYAFQSELHRKLCEKYHDECVVNSESSYRFVDFEVHIYGRNPFRLSEHLNQYPKEVGIVNNCVINISEIQDSST